MTTSVKDRVSLHDPLNRVCRLIWRKDAQRADHIVLDLKSGYRGVVECMGGSEDIDDIYIRPVSTRTSKKDPDTELIKVSISRPEHDDAMLGNQYYTCWSKGTLEIIVYRHLNDAFDRHHKWTTVKDTP